jgi:hypothetical protein
MVDVSESAGCPAEGGSRPSAPRLLCRGHRDHLSQNGAGLHIRPLHLGYPGHVKTRCAARAGTLSRDARRPVTRAPVTRAAAGPGAGLCPAGIQQCRAAPGVWRLGRERRNSARSKYLPSAGWPLRAAPGPAAAGRAAGARLRAAPRRWWAAQGLADRLRPGLDPRYAITTDLDESVIIATIASPDGEPAGPLLIDGYALRSLSS